jgi:hypothetical protein
MQRSLTKLGLSWISARSKHPKQDREAHKNWILLIIPIYAKVSKDFSLYFLNKIYCVIFIQTLV